MKIVTDQNRVRLRPGSFKSALEVGPSRLNTLKFKLEEIHRRATAAFDKGDHQTKKQLEFEAAQLSATIARAEALVTCRIRYSANK